MMAWSGPSWPIFIIMPVVMVTMMAIMVLMMRGTFGFGPGRHSGRSALDEPPPPPVTPPARDPMVILRERLVEGEIDLTEYEARLEALLRSDPDQKMPWWSTHSSGEPSSASTGKRARR